MKGKLYLLPTTLGENNPVDVIPETVLEKLNHINIFIVENVRTARRYLKRAGIKTAIDDLKFYVLDKRTTADRYASYLKLIKNEDIGLLSEAGCPAVADPGANIVALAHQKGIQVIPFVGPSSILLSLMASGFNGQNFAFVGYIPVKKNERIKALKKIEKRSLTDKQTQIFIETPYRNNQILEDLINACSKKTKLCIACDITLSSEFIQTKTLGEWRKNKPDLHKRPAIFLILA